MKKPLIISACAFLALVCLAATTVLPGKRIRDYPNNGNPSTNARYIMEKGDFSTNENISHQQLLFLTTNALTAQLKTLATTNFVNSITNGLATTNYVNTVTTIVSNGVVTLIITTSNTLFGTSQAAGSNLVVVLSGTNTLVSKTSTNGTNFYVVNADPFAITNGLATTNYANEVASNRVVVLSGTNTLVSQTSTNGTNFYAVNSTATASASSIGFQTNQFTTNVAGTPVVGSLWFNGTNGLLGTNGARVAMEYIPFRRSLRFGEIADSLDVFGNPGGTNFWNDTNIGPVTIGLGSNVLVRGAYSSVLGGAYNQIGTNSKFSVIGGGQNNKIDTNAHTSVIAGGGRNSISNVNAIAGDIGNSTISGGSNNVITGTIIIYATIGGGGDNLITGARETTIAGGFGNTIRLDGRGGFIGGGDNNLLGSGDVTEESQGSFIGGGSQNILRGDYSFIGGGYQNNLLAREDNYCVIVGGQLNKIGVANTSESTHATISGGSSSLIEANSHYSVISGGRNNTIQTSCTNSVVVGGYNNFVENNAPFVNILGGRDNYVTGTGDYGTIIGFSNNVSAEAAIAIGRNLTNNRANSVLMGGFYSGSKVEIQRATNLTVGGTIIGITTPVASAGAAETNLITATIPGHTLTNSQDRMTFRMSGRFAATANAKNLKVVYGSETILDTGSQIVNSGAWTVEGEIIRTGNTAQSVNAEYHGNGESLYTTASSLDLVQTNGISTVLKMTSTAAGDGDVTNRTMTVWLWPSP